MANSEIQSSKLNPDGHPVSLRYPQPRTAPTSKDSTSLADDGPGSAGDSKVSDRGACVIFSYFLFPISRASYPSTTVTHSCPRRHIPPVLNTRGPWRFLSQSGESSKLDIMPSAIRGAHADDVHEQPDPTNDSIPSHPLGVKPLGNQYLSDGPNAKASIGVWACLPDEVLMTVLEYFDKSCLFSLGSTCKFLYAFCHSEELWKALFLQ